MQYVILNMNNKGVFCDGKKVPNKKIIDHLNSILWFEKDTTFNTFFSMIIDNKEIFEQLFKSHMREKSMQDIIDEYNHPEVYVKKHHINIWWNAENLDIDQEYDLWELIEFPMYGVSEVIGNGKKQKLNPLCVLSEFPLNRMKNATLGFDTDYTIFGECPECGEMEPVFESRKMFKIFDLLVMFFDMVTLHSTREEKIESMNKVLKKKRENNKPVKLEDKLITYEKNLELAVKSEDYETAARLRDNIANLKNVKHSKEVKKHQSPPP